MATIVPPPLALIAGRAAAIAVHDTVEVDGHGTAVRLRVEVVTHAAPGGHACIEVRNVEGAESLEGSPHRLGARGRVSDVGPHEEALQLIGDRSAARLVDVGEDHTSARRSQVARHALTDAVAPSGDEGNLAVDVHDGIVGDRGELSR